MFYAMAERKIDLRGYRLAHRLEDIQTLNERALLGELHISAISIHAYAYVAGKYALLPCGASMGDGYGPIIIRNRRTPNFVKERGSHGALLSQRTTYNEYAEVRKCLSGIKIEGSGNMYKSLCDLKCFL